jgi:hypothetical protein
MGVYNFVKIEDPRYPDLHGLEFQTKDGNEVLYLETYTITKDGRLTLKSNKYKFEPDMQKEGFRALEGALKVVSSEIIDENYHGYFCFYGNNKECKAKFTDGHLESIEVIND